MSEKTAREKIQERIEYLFSAEHLDDDQYDEAMGAAEQDALRWVLDLPDPEPAHYGWAIADKDGLLREMDRRFAPDADDVKRWDNEQPWGAPHSGVRLLCEAMDLGGEA